MAKTKAVAAGSGGITANIAVRDARAAIDFYCKAFGAVELFRLIDPTSDRIGHAELRIGNGLLMLSDEYPDFGAISPDALGGTAVKLHIDTADADQMFANALKAGATQLRKPELQFHGCKQGLVADPFGYSWFISQKQQDVTPAEMQKRWNKMTKL